MAEEEKPKQIIRYCPQCKTKYKQGKFCKTCGQPLQVIDEQGSVIQQEACPAEPTAPKAPAQPSPFSEAFAAASTNSVGAKVSDGAVAATLKKLPKAAWGAIVAGLVALIAIIAIVLSLTSCVDLNKYVDVEFEGYNSIGKAQLNFDVERFLKDCHSDYSNILLTDEAYELANKCSVTPKIGLSNGDEVTINWEVDTEKLSELCNCKIKAESITKKVEGLEECETYDPFEGVDVKFDNASNLERPKAIVDIKTPDNEAQRKLKYRVLEEKFKNGDEVTVSVVSNEQSQQAVEAYAKEHGLVPSPSSKKFKVSGLYDAVTDVKQIPEEAMKKLQKASVKTLKDELDASKTEFVGTYLLNNKEDVYDNILYLVYKVNVPHKDIFDVKVSSENVSYYAAACLRYFGVNDAGEINPSSELKLCTETSFEPFDDDYWFSAWGSKTLKEFYDEVVTSKLNSYTHQDNVEEK